MEPKINEGKRERTPYTDGKDRNGKGEDRENDAKDDSTTDKKNEEYRPFKTENPLKCTGYGLG